MCFNLYLCPNYFCMKKVAILGIVLLIIVANSCSKKIVVNRIVKDDEGKYMMIGRQTQESFSHEGFANWFTDEYNSYQPEAQSLEQIKGKINQYNIVIFMGTWCSDSRREVPRFLKILDAVNFPKEKLEIYAVNRKRESFYGEEQGKNIIRVPTFIFYTGKKKVLKNQQKEINRIIETPVNGKLEIDIAKIVNKQPYTPNYFY